MPISQDDIHFDFHMRQIPLDGQYAKSAYDLIYKTY